MSVEPLQPGVRLGPDGRRYTVERVLGAGGFAITYAARDERLGGTVAIKEFGPPVLAERGRGERRLSLLESRRVECSRALARFVRESQRLNQVQHGNVVRVFDAWRQHGTAYYAMDWVPDARLFPQRKQGGPPPPVVHGTLQLFRSVLDGLEAIHDAGLVHGDVKPQNILLRPDGSPVLIDFGTARTETELSADTVTVLYTPGWTAPELESPSGVRQAGPWSDLYSFGMLVWGYVLGHRNEHGLPATAASRASAVDPYGDAVRRLRDAGLPPGWADAVTECIRIVPGERPPNAGAVRDIIVGVRHVEESATPSGGMQRRAPSRDVVRACRGCQELSPHTARYCVVCGAELELPPVPARDVVPAPLTRRALAAAVDVALVLVAGIALVEAGDWFPSALQWFALLGAIGWTTDAVVTGLRGGTPGKLLLGLEVRDADGDLLSPRSSARRTLTRAALDVCALSPVGYVWAIVRRGVTWTDLVARTRVTVRDRGRR